MAIHPFVVERRRVALSALAVLVTGSLGMAVGLGASASGANADAREQTPAVQTHEVTAGLASDEPDWRPSNAHDDHTDGEVFEGLGHSDHCDGGFGVEDGSADHAADAEGCSHGPDEAPPGVDVQEKPTTAELRAEAGEQAGDDGRDVAGGSDSDDLAAGSSAVPCYGDGVTGKRIEAIYAVSSDQTDRYAQVAPLIRQYAATADDTFNNSAARDGGVRHLRWVTDSSCQLVVDHVVLSATGDDSLGNTRQELRALGFTSTDRKYVVFTDANVYCGIAYVVGDDTAGTANAANVGPTFARVDSACWSSSASVVAHEIAHTLGAVQLTAPHSNGGWHCTDESDRLCYADGTANAPPLTYPCASAGEMLLDCNGDDYFNVNPASGSWLSTHWNLANSAFLDSAGPLGWSPVSPTNSGSSGTTTTTPPTTTNAPPVRHVVSRWKSKITKNHRVRVFSFDASDGDITATIRAAKKHKLRVVVRTASGHLVLAKRAKPAFTASDEVPGGSYRVFVRGPIGQKFTLRVGRHLR